MTIGQIIVNLILGLLAFFVVRWICDQLLPEGQDKPKIAVALGLLAGILVFLANPAARILV